VIKASVEGLFLGAGAGLILSGLLAATRPEIRSFGSALPLKPHRDHLVGACAPD
jgi:hypothetical protein